MAIPVFEAEARFGTTTLFQLVLCAILTLLVLWQLYRRFLLPQPLPGIPYNAAAASSWLGDMPDMVRHVTRTGELFAWLSEQNVKHASPIVQVFPRPFSAPWVVLSDPRETEDIMIRRVPRDFDISAFTADQLGGVIPEHHSRWQTNDEHKRRRRLVDDLMTPSFLKEACAPLLYESSTQLIDLWMEKKRLAGNRPFSALKDISCCAMDAVLAFTFGPGLGELSAMLPNLTFLSSLASPLAVSSDGTSDDKFDPDSTKPFFEFSTPLPNTVIESLFAISNSLETALKSPFPVLAHWFLRLTPSMRKATREKEALIRQQINLSVSRIVEQSEQSGSTAPSVRCAVDEMVRRETLQAAKAGRLPAFQTPHFYDELYAFVLGGHESTSNANQWALKRLARHQDQQNKLRAYLRDAYPRAVAEGRAPTASEIVGTPCAYLDATIEELFRTSFTAPMCVRDAVKDTVVLGKYIPKGTVLFHVFLKSGYTQPAFNVDESLRSEAAKAAMAQRKNKNGVLPGDEEFDPAIYAPERWLTKSADGKDVFDVTRSRNMIFGMGPRGCFGRKLAYLQFRMLMVLVVWNFQLLDVPAELDSNMAYDKLTREPQDCYVRLGEPVLTAPV